MNEIDFVLTWVDARDEQWRNSRQHHAGGYQTGNLESHYRDWGTLKFWFRTVEKYASWVRKIHFVTCGHYPEWLNTNHPKLNLVSHDSYMSADYLPTFSINPIELNLHRIPGLSERFVYFNDDTFLNDYVNESDFFRNGLPCDSALLSSLIPSIKHEVITYILFNDLLLINYHFNKQESINRHLLKWFSPKYTRDFFRNIYYYPMRRFPGFMNPHLPNSFLRSTFVDVWQKEYACLNETSKHKFRTRDDVNQYLMRYWQLAKGNFVPRNSRFGKCFTVGVDNDVIFNALKTCNPKVICINDSNDITEEDMDATMNKIVDLYNVLYPDKSEFEI